MFIKSLSYPFPGYSDRVLSSEMDPTKLGSFDRSSLKSEQIANSAHSSVNRPFIHYMQLLAMALWTNLEIWRTDYFKPRMLLFSVGNGTMNASWYYGVMNAPRFW
jgi:hypothetical protein